MREKIRKIIKQAVGQKCPDFSVETPINEEHGDYSTNIALVLAKRVGKSPREVAEGMVTKIKNNKIFFKIEIAGPGFINFFISNDYLLNQLKLVIKEKNKFGILKIGKGQKVNVEFISANPTGPLTLGNGRGGFGGDVLCNVLEKAGFKVFREYYINDTGLQITKLGHSVLGDDEAIYKGDYIENLKNKIKGKNPDEVGKKAAGIILKTMIKLSVKKMGISFDKWFSETSLYKNKEVDKVIQQLTKKGFTYKSEGALWFKSKDFGDDKDRVLVRADGIKTYFASDIAYLENKFKRGFKKLVFFLGADHYGYVARLKAACQAIGRKKENIEPQVLQLVKLFENGKEVRMSKRTGLYVTIDELIDEVGLDVVRFFFLQRSLDTHFNFDMNLAKEKSEKNPVYKVQYAYARINSIIAKAKIKKPLLKIKFEMLNSAEDLELIKKIIKYPEIIESAANDYQLQRLPAYAIELSESFHKFYEKCQVISEDKELTTSRVALITAFGIVLKELLNLMGVSAPKKM